MTPPSKISKKIVLLGNFGVGKTSMIKKFVHNLFSDKYLTTIGVSIEKKVIEIDGIEINLIIWDVAGEKDISTINDAYIRGTNGAIFVFDLSRESTYENLSRDLEIVNQKTKEAPLVVVGNKVDLLTENELAEVNNKVDVPYFANTSAKTGEMVEETFKELANLLLHGVR